MGIKPYVKCEKAILNVGSTSLKICKKFSIKNSNKKRFEKNLWLSQKKQQMKQNENIFTDLKIACIVGFCKKFCQFFWSRSYHQSSSFTHYSEKMKSFFISLFFLHLDYLKTFFFKCMKFFASNISNSMEFCSFIKNFKAIQTGQKIGEIAYCVTVWIKYDRKPSPSNRKKKKRYICAPSFLFLNP